MAEQEVEDLLQGCPSGTAQAGAAEVCQGCPGAQACQRQRAQDAMDARRGGGGGSGGGSVPRLAALRGVQRSVFVLSGKGGVGKSTTTALLAQVLADLDRVVLPGADAEEKKADAGGGGGGAVLPNRNRVAVLDADLCGPSMPSMMRVQGLPVVQRAGGWVPPTGPDRPPPPRQAPIKFSLDADFDASKVAQQLEQVSPGSLADRRDVSSKSSSSEPTQAPSGAAATAQPSAVPALDPSLDLRPRAAAAAAAAGGEDRKEEGVDPAVVSDDGAAPVASSSSGSTTTTPVFPRRRGEHRIAVMSIGSLLPDRDSAVVWRGPRKTHMLTRMLRDTNWGSTDWLLVDTPPGTSDEHLSVLSTLKRGSEPDGAVIVTTPQDVSLATVRKEINFCSKMNLRILGIIENMSSIICPCCNEESELFVPLSAQPGAASRAPPPAAAKAAGETTGAEEEEEEEEDPLAGLLGGERLARETGVPFLGRVPLDPRVTEAVDQGHCAVCTASESPALKAVADIAIRLDADIRANRIKAAELRSAGDA